MAVDEERDFIDDLIDISESWNALSNPLGSVVDSLVDPNTQTFDASKYREKPYVNSIRCMSCAMEGELVCTECLDVCPVDAIEIGKKSIKILDNCRECLLCAAACPTEAIISRHVTQEQIYERLTRAASAFEEAYITCTRAMSRLGRKPFANEVVVPCVGALSKELWFSLLTNYVNVNVFLQSGICERCRTSTGEEFFSGAIATGEAWSQGSVGLVEDEEELTQELTRAYKRSQFISGALQAGERLVSRTTPMLAGARAVAKRISDHKKQLETLRKTVEEAVGTKTSANRQRMLTSSRRLMMAALQYDPELADDIELEVPEFDPALCTLCGDCAQACTTHALDLRPDGHVIIEDIYCVNCSVCALVCAEEALQMVATDAGELVVVDEESEKIAQARAEARAEAARLMEKGKQGLDQAGNILERIGEAFEEEE